MALPSARHPRLLVPAGRPAAAARAMLRFSAALAVEDTVKRLGVAALLRVGVTAPFPDRITVTERSGSLRSHLAEVLGEPVDVSLGLGTARANRKPVLEVFDRRGRSIAFVKVGGTQVSDDLVRAESGALSRLAERRLPASIEVPTVLHSGEWHGAAILVMSSLPTSFRQRPSRQLSVPVGAMTGLHAAFHDEDRPLVETPAWTSMSATVAALPTSAAADRLAGALAALADRAAGHVVGSGAWHGDWTPWNMSRSRGRLRLWDWERFETGVPDGLDRAHYGVNVVCRRDGVRAEATLRGLALAGLHAEGPPADYLAAATYLALITTRYLAAAGTDASGTVEQRGLVMLEALTRWLELREGVPHV